MISTHETFQPLTTATMEVKHHVVETLIQKLSSVSEPARIEALCELRLISKNDAETRPLVAQAGAIPYLSETLYSSAPICQENAAATLHNLTISSTDDIMAAEHGVLDALSHALRHPASPFAAQCAAATIFNLVMVDAYRVVIGQKRDIVYSLIEIVKTAGSPARSVKDALKGLFGIALSVQNRPQLIELGAVPALFTLVLSRIGFLEDSTAVIAQIAGCEQSWEAFEKVSGLRILVDLLDHSTGSSYRTKENVVSGLLNLTKFGNGLVVDGIRGFLSVEAIDGILDVEENGSEKGKGKAKALLAILELETFGSSGGCFVNGIENSS